MRPIEGASSPPSWVAARASTLYDRTPNEALIARLMYSRAPFRHQAIERVRENRYRLNGVRS